MTLDQGPFCVHCGRPTRFNMGGAYQCKQGCEQAAAEAEAGARAMSEYQAASANLAEIGKRTTIPAPAPPSLELTGSPEHVIEVLEAHPELGDVEVTVEPEPEPEPETEPETESEPEPVAAPVATQPRTRGKRRRR